jgi:hypothetical protein
VSANDWRGVSVLGLADYFAAGDRTLTVQVPMGGIPTPVPPHGAAHGAGEPAPTAPQPTRASAEATLPTSPAGVNGL